MKYLWDYRNIFKEKGNWVVVNSLICYLWFILILDYCYSNVCNGDMLYFFIIGSGIDFGNYIGDFFRGGLVEYFVFSLYFCFWC